jgi:hypothetical protein
MALAQARRPPFDWSLANEQGPGQRIRWSGPYSSLSQTSALGGTRTPNLLIRSYFTSPNLRLKTPALTLVACPLTSTDVCWFPSWLLYFSAVLPALADWRPAARQPAGWADGAWRSSAAQSRRFANQGEQSLASGDRAGRADGFIDRSQTFSDLHRHCRCGPLRHAFGTDT